MKVVYKPNKGLAILELLFYIIIANGLVFILTKFIDAYIETRVIITLVIAFSIYCIYYILLDRSLKYILTDEAIEINGLWGFKKNIIKFNEIDGYLIQDGNIHGFRLSGFGRLNYCFGRCVVEKVGISHMFVTASKQIMYIHTEEMSYGISPKDIRSIEEVFISKGIEIKEFEVKKNKNVDLFKQKTFFIPFIIVSLVVIVMTLNPFVLYLMNKLPGVMPLAFNSNFTPILYGTGKQFAFKQMTYGALNMVVLFCMYYAAYFCARYDRRSAYKYIYISLILTLSFFIIQLQILGYYI
ncbi:PH domain-containing protein [Clostridium cavendishii DSM 21758]|uniref:PH domain-containing protein n=1 Tax=Clostridium cavendishii DSM 21758 TaxID=1121302 RepID=A0A1M6AKH1_9CLOT|nr:PH domain-containing protein [Clostridium cavendishii]SHI37019.1 PH domain-containing protein [Clostridium cavendishii DSM 21758]